MSSSSESVLSYISLFCLGGKLYEKEKGTTGHEIKVNIPYSVEINDPSVSNLGNISSDGKCELYKKVLFWEHKIVDITATKTSLNIIR